ncbi:MAG: response regulator transcription factor [Anaerolineae bacterium]|nr:response regulator transcription factor [Anaerolineae bacterium]MCO5197860.1 response regulator transcription factor [Anaerolineae bacterium]MCO5205356.1 response regulator transcription factor [Anaerolineae bacterium]
MDETIRIFLADDHAVVLRGLQALIGTEPDMEVVGTANNGRSAVTGVSNTQPDVVILDLEMPHMTGLEAIEPIKAAHPPVKILIVTSFSDDEHVFTAIKRGALGYLLKDASPEELLRAIRDVHAEKTTLHPDIALKLIRELKGQPQNAPDSDIEPLTEREIEVLQLIARGWSNQQIATHLVISERTVRTHISNILGKLHLANRTQAALYAMREGLARLDDGA